MPPEGIRKDGPQFSRTPCCSGGSAFGPWHHHRELGLGRCRRCRDEDVDNDDDDDDDDDVADNRVGVPSVNTDVDREVVVEDEEGGDTRCPSLVSAAACTTFRYASESVTVSIWRTRASKDVLSRCT